jgi:hypothetical protein
MASKTKLNWVLGDGPSKVPLPPSILSVGKFATALNILAPEGQSGFRRHREEQLNGASTASDPA